MQNIKFAPGDTPLGKPYIDNKIPEPACRMNIRKVISKDDLYQY